MGHLFEMLSQDVRFVESLKACINCGTCTAICPAAEFYNYDPRVIAVTVQSQDDARIEELLKGDAIWYCGECMSCKTRCPRGNTPGLTVIALRSLSQDLGYFTESEKGRQQLAIKRTIGENILKYGYCVHPEALVPELHTEQGPVWEWEYSRLEPLMEKLGANFHGEGPGALRKIEEDDLDEIRRIFEVTGGAKRFGKIEEYSRDKASQMGLEFGEGTGSEYFKEVYTANNQTHNNPQ